MEKWRQHPKYTNYMISNKGRVSSAKTNRILKQNNNVGNLEWVTHKENIQHAVKNKLRVIPKKLSNIEISQIYDIIDETKYTYMEIGQMFGANRNTVYHMNLLRR